MNDRIEGAVREGVGRVQDAFGGAVGDEKTQAKGKINEAAGAIQNKVGQVTDQAGDLYDQAEAYVRDQPAIAVAVAAGLGILVGLILRGPPKTIYIRK